MRITIMSAAALAVLCGCGGSGTQAAGGNENSAIGSYATPDGTAEVRSGDAALSGLPDGIPPYPRADGTGAIQFGGQTEEGDARVMGFRTADAPADVIAFYTTAGASAGFREVHRASTGSSVVLGLERDNGDVMNITATGSPGGTMVQIMAGQQRRSS